MKTILIFVLSLIVPSLSFGQSEYNENSIREVPLKYVDLLSNRDIVQDIAIGEGGMKPKQYEYFEGLRNVATDEELFELTNHPNPIVRTYSFWGLYMRKSDNVIDVMSKNINDTVWITQQFGCLESEVTVIEFMTDRIIYDYDKTVYDSNKQFIDSLTSVNIGRERRKFNRMD